MQKLLLYKEHTTSLSAFFAYVVMKISKGVEWVLLLCLSIFMASLWATLLLGLMFVVELVGKMVEELQSWQTSMHCCLTFFEFVEIKK